MRITNNMMITNMMQNLNRNMLRLDKRQMQAATGKRIHTPSDDPVAISRSLKIRSDISQLNQFKRNVDDAVSFLETTEMAVRNVGAALTRLRELTVQASNGVLTNEDTLKIRSEVRELKEQIIKLGNTTYAGKYIFSGKKSNEPLFDENGEYRVDLDDFRNPQLVDDRIRFEVGIGETIEINTLGFDIFDDTRDPELNDSGNISVPNGRRAGIIRMIELIEQKLADESLHTSLTEDIANIDRFIDINLTVRGEIGAKHNRMELVQNRIASDIVNFKALQTQIEDADMGEVIMNLLNEENVYRASLAIGARIIQPSLLDFLR